MNKKVLSIIIVSLILLIIGTFIIISLNNEMDYKIINKKNIEVYSKIKISELVSIENGKILNDDYIDTTKVGNKKIKFKYLTDNSSKKEGEFYIKIVDTEKPYIGISGTYMHVIGNEFNLETTTFCGDNVTVNPKCIIEGDYNLEKIGEYPLIFKAIDESGNINEKNFILKVVEKKSKTSSNKIKFDEIKNMLPSDAVLMVDVSKWQEEIDWKTVKQSGIDYAMLRLGTQKGIDQESIVDSYFDKNIKEARENGIKVGVYYFSYANDIDDAIKQGEWVVNILKDYEIDLPVAFDWECWNFFNKFDLNFYQLNMIAEAFLIEIENKGYKAILYGSKNYIENVWKYLDYDIWLAHYTKSTNYTGKKKIWQFTNIGEVPGIKGNVDVNFYYYEN